MNLNEPAISRSVNRIALQCENIVMLSSLLAEHQKIISLSAIAPKVPKGFPQSEKGRVRALDRTHGAITALQAAIYTMYEGMGDELKSLLQPPPRPE